MSVAAPHLLADISAHGLGHLAQTAPLLNALREACPDLRLTVRSALSRAALERRIDGPFAHIAMASDFGLLMHNAVDVDGPASLSRYRAFHADWPARVAAEAEQLKALKVDALIANVAYLPLAGAKLAGIPALGLCSLNWADIFGHYLGAAAGAAVIEQQMLEAYNAADCFLRLTPGLPMARLSNARSIGPLVAAPPARATARHAVAAALGLDTARRWVLVAMGGMEFRLPIDTWPLNEEVIWLCPAEWRLERRDIAGFDGLCRVPSFAALLAAADAVITKPGYGTFVEAAVCGTPLLYLARPDWPETAHFAAWLTRNGRADVIARDALLGGRVMPLLEDLWRLPAPPAVQATGLSAACEEALRLLRFLRESGR